MARQTDLSCILNCNVVDVRRGEVRERANVHISNGRIVGIDTRRARASESAATIDAGGLFLAPGLIDMHVHLAFNPSLQSPPVSAKVDLRERAIQHLGDALRGGVTTVRDLGSPGGLANLVRQDWENAQRQNSLFGARPIFSGPIITSIGGHGAWVGTEIGSPTEMMMAIDERKANDIGWIKFAMSSAARPTEFSPEMLLYGVEYAHSLGLKVAVHANFSENSVRAAIEAGCDTLEHGYLMPTDILSSTAAPIFAICPTLTAIHSVHENEGLAVRRVGPELPLAIERSMPTAERTLRACYEYGVPIVAGTDAGVLGVEFDAIHREMDLLRQWGVDNLTAVRAATLTAADVLDEPVGAIEEGRIADLLLVSANPLEDAEHLRKPEAVIAAGRLTTLRS